MYTCIHTHVYIYIYIYTLSKWVSQKIKREEISVWGFSTMQEKKA